MLSTCSPQKRSVDLWPLSCGKMKLDTAQAHALSNRHQTGFKKARTVFTSSSLLFLGCHCSTDSVVGNCALKSMLVESYIRYCELQYWTKGSIYTFVYFALPWQLWASRRCRHFDVSNNCVSTCPIAAILCGKIICNAAATGFLTSKRALTHSLEMKARRLCVIVRALSLYSDSVMVINVSHRVSSTMDTLSLLLHGCGVFVLWNIKDCDWEKWCHHLFSFWLESWTGHLDFDLAWNPHWLYASSDIVTLFSCFIFRYLCTQLHLDV